MENKELVVYTDGGCSGNPGPGGWGCVILDDSPETLEKEKVLSGGEKLTTNNRMELMAVINALEYILSKPETSSCNVAVYIDSQYVKNGITSWIHTWKKNGWKTSSKGAVKNKELWEQLDNAVQKLSIRWTWVKGHSGVKYNELVDQLTQKEIANFR